MKELEGRVVVDITITSVNYGDSEQWAARIKDMGITAYAKSEDDATSKAMTMFAQGVRVNRKYGHLERWLDSLNLVWRWADGYVHTGPREYRDVHLPQGSRVAERSRKSPPSMSYTPSDEYALAA